jgi:predicted transcriptional regulator
MARRNPKKPPATRKRALAEPASSLAVPPEMYDQVRRLFFRGRSVRGIATLLGLHYDSLRHFVATVLRPEIQAAGIRKSAEILEEIRELREFAWQQLERVDVLLRDETEKTVEGTAREGGRSKPTAKRIAAEVERIISTYPNTSGSRWATVVQWCLEHEARLLGHYRQPIMEAPTEFRVAGKTPDQVNREMVERILESVRLAKEVAAERQAYERRRLIIDATPQAKPPPPQ